MIQHMLILAQTQPQQPQNPLLFFGFILAAVVFMMMVSRSGSKREKRKKQELLDGLKKNDRVMTIGGIIGTVVSVKENEIVLKVDEATNTRMTFLKKSIQQVIIGPEDLSAESSS